MKGRSHSVQFAAIAVGVTMALLVLLLITRHTRSDDPTGPTVVGMVAPAVNGKALIGKPYDIGTNDRWLVVNFFATWCAPCVAEHPELRAFSEEHAKDGKARVVSIVYGDNAAATRRFFQRNGGNWSVLDSAGGRTALDWRVSRVPESYLVSPEGIVAQRFVGGVTKDLLDRAIDQGEAARNAATVGGS